MGIKLFLGPPAIGKSNALKITPFELCEIAWFSWQQTMRFKTVGNVPTNYLYLFSLPINKIFEV